MILYKHSFSKIYIFCLINEYLSRINQYKKNDYELRNIKEKMNESGHQKKFGNQYSQFAIILDEIKKKIK